MTEKKIPKKRGRKPKKKNPNEPPVVKVPKKRGRKPKGGKIIKKKDINKKKDKVEEPNIVLHLKCKVSDLEKKNLLTNTDYNPDIANPEAFNILDSNLYSNVNDNFNKKEEVNEIIQSKTLIDNMLDTKESEPEDVTNDKINMKEIWKKIAMLKNNLRHNNFPDKRSACHWCTCSFDNPCIYIPSKIKNNIYEVYGCFCSPECAVAFLLNEKLDISTIWERYSMLNNIYSKIYNRNIKPAPNPLYTLNKFYGNLSIQEYRKLLNNDTLLMVVDKPMSKILPELYEENNEIPNVYSNLLDKKNNTFTKLNELRLQSKTKNQNKLKIFNNIY